MFTIPGWDICGIIAIAFLAISFMRRRNATWAGLLVGFIIGVIIAFIYFLKDDAEFNWSLIKKVCIVAVFIGAFIDILNFLITPRRKRV
jgi:hypothetical protein